MTFAELYKNHAYADLIQEAETQGIDCGVLTERERIIKLLDNYCDGNHSMFDQCSCAMQIALIKGENW